jgi:hypothetical protein
VVAAPQWRAHVGGPGVLDEVAGRDGPAFNEFSGSLTKAPFLKRAAHLGELVGQYGLDVEYRLGDYLSPAIEAR